MRFKASVKVLFLFLFSLFSFLFSLFAYRYGRKAYNDMRIFFIDTDASITAKQFFEHRVDNTKGRVLN